VVMQQGDLGSEFYIVVQGELVARVWRETTPTPGGASSGDGGGGSGGGGVGGGLGPGPLPSGASSRELLVLGPGQYLGERALMAPISRPATVVARGEVRLCVCVGGGVLWWGGEGWARVLACCTVCLLLRSQPKQLMQLLLGD
jgi:CRP-like cAMP-binding protein